MHRQDLFLFSILPAIVTARWENDGPYMGNATGASCGQELLWPTDGTAPDAPLRSDCQDAKEMIKPWVWYDPADDWRPSWVSGSCVLVWHAGPVDDHGFGRYIRNTLEELFTWCDPTLDVDDRRMDDSHPFHTYVSNYAWKVIDVQQPVAGGAVSLYRNGDPEDGGRQSYYCHWVRGECICDGDNTTSVCE